MFGLAVLLVVAGYGAYALLRPLGSLKTTLLPPVMPAEVRLLTPWPEKGQAAFGADGYGPLASHGEQKPQPTASIAKTITALAILEKKPLKKGEAGPRITVTAQDVKLYDEYVAKDGSVVPVIEGETFSEYEALQAMMLPSANNIADTAAIWAFGSMEAYTNYANQMVKKLGMRQTTVSDASGFSPATVSTAKDLVRLGDAALDHPVLAEIIAQKEAIFPGYGTMKNVNSFIGQNGIRGIKTGNTDQAGGCYLAAADIEIAGEKVTIITAIMGDSSRPQAMRDSIPLIQSTAAQFAKHTIASTGQVVGHVTSPWGQTSDIIAQKDMTVLSWKGTALSPRGEARTVRAPVAHSEEVGSLKLRYSGKVYTSPITIKSDIHPPSVWWRLTHPI
jgi:D-alanyl-D-alanine carboxypeptidase (penicillin-binding protein 5/6)